MTGLSEVHEKWVCKYFKQTYTKNCHRMLESLCFFLPAQMTGEIDFVQQWKMQSFVHISALLFTLAEVSPRACTSLPCAWSSLCLVKLSRGGMAMATVELVFAKVRMYQSMGLHGLVGPSLDPSRL